MRKILFLDFDGVLHPASDWQTRPFSQAHALALCLRPYDCAVVVSSSWCFQRPADLLVECLPGPIAKRVIGVTGEAHIGMHAKYQEIMNQLRDHASADTVSWRALDDSYWDFPPRLPELIICNPNHGVQAQQLLELEHWL